MRVELSALALFLLLAACDSEEEEQKPDDTGRTTEPQDTEPPYEYVYPDEDRDGYTADEDCNDNDYQDYPGAEERCDGIDNDCDEEIDEDFDADLDGYLSMEECKKGDDCDDGDAASYPGADEVAYDGVDQDCDGADLTDTDGDGYPAEEAGGNDCDDTDAEIYPGVDHDGDGYGACSEDCDDTDAEVHPGQFDWWNDGLDNDCDGEEEWYYEFLEAGVAVEGSSGSDDLVGYGIDACDLDEDGFSDLLVGAPFASSYAGDIGIWYGNGSMLWTDAMTMNDADTLISGNGYDFIGWGVLCGDVDGDGHDDVVISRGEIDYSSYQADFGLLIYYGEGKAFDPSLSDAQADAELTLEMGVTAGKPVVYSIPFQLGDLDGDGAAELIVNWSSDKNYDPSALLVVDGARYEGALALDDYLSDWFTPSQDYSLARVRVVSDLDGDGNLDLFAGEAYYYEDESDTGDPEGRASFTSGLQGFDGEAITAAAHALLDGTDDLYFGYDMATGDFDGDGLDDGAIAAIGDATDSEYGGGIYVYSDMASYLSGAPKDPVNDADGHIYGTTANGLLGYRLHEAGDLNGDGYDELLASEYYGGSSNQGRIWLLSGLLLSYELPVEEAALLAFQGDNSDNSVGYDLVGGVDFDGDGLPDVAYSAPAWDNSDSTPQSGRVAVHLSSQMGLPD